MQTTLWTLLNWTICGLLVGLIARAVMPGRQSLSLLLTAVLGVIGAMIGGFLYWSVKGQPGVGYSLAGNSWHGWIVSILGACLALWFYPILRPRAWGR